MSGLSGRRIIVTGGFGALGRAASASLSASGARVAVIDAGEGRGADEALAHAERGVDLADAGQAEQAVARSAEALGGLDGLVNLAGGFAWQTVEAGDPQAWEVLWRTNVLTALHASRSALPYLKASQRGGRVVNVGAAAATRAAAGMGAYAAAKSGVARLTESLAAETLDGTVTVNAVLPSIIDTEANRAAMGAEQASRWVSPDDLVAVIAFLLSDAGRAVTGALVPVTNRVAL